MDFQIYEKIRWIGFEVAHLGRYGINPEKKETYNLNSVPSKTFTGWQLLAWMYTSWSIFAPAQVGELGLDFGGELVVARRLMKK